MTSKYYFIDSFTTFTPLEDFVFVNPEFDDLHVVLNTETGEVKDEKKLPIYFSDDIGVKFRASVVSLFGVSYLRLTFTSKMLGDKYFDGINLTNFKQVFLKVLKIINCNIDYYVFLHKSIINDVDFSCDFLMSDGKFGSLLQPYKENKGAKLFYQKVDYLQNNRLLGLQFVNRKDASIKYPFIKFYTKLEELLQRSELFYNFLLKNGKKISPNHRRIECTIKNKKHFESIFKTIGISRSDINLLGVLSFSQPTIRDIINALLGRYERNFIIPVKERDKKDIQGLTPANYMLARMALQLMKESGYTLDQVIQLFEDFPESTPVSKSRLSKRIRQTFPIVEEYHRKIDDLKNLRVTAHDAFFT